MAHGVVPVVSRFRGCRAEGQFRDEETALLFDVGHTAGAAECVRRLHGDRALLRRLAANARCSQEGICSEEGALAAWAARFTEALERPAQGPRTAPGLAACRSTGALGLAGQLG